MTTLREAATMALETMKRIAVLVPRDDPQAGEAITALKVALAEPDWQDLYLKEKKRADMWRDKYESVAGAEQRIYPLAEPVQEPVAWVLALPDGRLDRLSVVAYDDEAEEMLQRSIAGCTLVPLYPSPPQRLPLTEEEIDSIWDSEKVFPDIYAIARAIERAHGIMP